MKEIDELTLEELNRRYKEQAEQLAEELERKAIRTSEKVEIYRDVYEDVTKGMEWVYEQLGEIAKFDNYNEEQKAKIALIQEKVAEIETKILKAKDVITDLEEQAKTLTDEHKQVLLAQKIASYKTIVEKAEPIKQVAKHKIYKGGDDRDR